MKKKLPPLARSRAKRDTLVRYIVTSSGALVLLTLLVLVSHLLLQTLPLALKPVMTEVSALKKSTLGDNGAVQILALSDVVEGQPLIVRKQDCKLSLMTFGEAGFAQSSQLIRPCSHTLGTLSAKGKNYLVDISPSGLVRIDPTRDYSPLLNVNTQNREPSLSDSLFTPATMSFSLPKAIWQARQAWHATLSNKWVVVEIHTPTQKWVRWVSRDDPTKVIDQQFNPDADLLVLPGIEQIALHSESRVRFYSHSGHIMQQVDLPVERVWWQSLENDRTLFIYDAQQRLSRWVLQPQSQQLRFVNTYSTDLTSFGVPKSIKAHASTNALAMLTDNQVIALLNRITGEIVSQRKISGDLSAISWFGDKIYAAEPDRVRAWNVKYLSGITTWSSLFRPQQYEGYPDAQTVWQTTNAADYLEAKYSLIPLLIGSLKASLLALIVAIPLSISAAIYTAFFARQQYRQFIKPAIELLEAIPSVLIGFIAAVWLAPVAGHFLLSFLCFLITVPVVLLIIAFFYHGLRVRLPVFFQAGGELLIGVVVIGVVGYISWVWAPVGLQVIFDNVQIDWFNDNAQSPIGKTTLVVAIALGIAISPAIYSLAEDAIHGVPDSLKHASYALGATRLQTLIYVVLYVALPGILAAIMLGFGRAFGETMIVLMVTGNTPVSSWNIFEGLRSLTANLAIELPEADVGSAHYNILFFTALMLFVFTFLINTLAEFLRKRLRGNARRG